MVPLIAAATIAGGASLAGSALDAFMQHKTNEQNTRLANSAHQREVQDLRKAGLNPILSAGGGGSPVPELRSPSSGISNAVNSALAARQAEANIALTGETARKAHVESNIAQQTEEMQLSARKVELNQLGANLDLTKAQRRIIDAQLIEIDQKINALKWENKFSAYDEWRAKSEAQYFKGVGGKINPYLKVLGAGINAANGLNNLRLRR